MKVVNVHSLPTELWYPYGRLGGTNGGQSTEDNRFGFADFTANRADYRQLDPVTPSL